MYLGFHGHGVVFLGFSYPFEWNLDLRYGCLIFAYIETSIDPCNLVYLSTVNSQPNCFDLSELNRSWVGFAPTALEANRYLIMMDLCWFKSSNRHSYTLVWGTYATYVNAVYFKF